jgi:AAA domain
VRHPRAAGQYARAVTATARLRRAQEALRRATQRLGSVAAEDLDEAIWEAMADLEEVVSDLAATDDHAGQALELDAFLHAVPPEHDWLVPGLLERGDRVILTPEGGGKSTLWRQVGVQVASGIHPFDPDARFPPLRVFLLDLENGERQVHRALRPMRLAVGDRYGGGMIIDVRPEGLDLASGDDGALLDALVAAARPDLLIPGRSTSCHPVTPPRRAPRKSSRPGWTGSAPHTAAQFSSRRIRRTPPAARPADPSGLTARHCGCAGPSSGSTWQPRVT